MTHDALLALIDLIYETATDAAKWPECLHQLVAALSARAAILSVHDFPSHGLAVLQTGVDPQAVLDYNAHYCELDPWARSPKAAGLLQAGKVTPGEALIPHQELVRGEFFNDFANKHDTSRLLTVVLGEAKSGHRSVLSLMRAERDRPFDSPEFSALTTLVTHLQRAVRLQGLIALAQAERDNAARSTDALSVGVVLVDGRGEVVMANATAMGILREADGLSVVNGELTAATAALTIELHRLCRLCAQSQTGGPAAARGLMLPRKSQRHPLQVIVWPANPIGALPLMSHPTGAIVYVIDPDRSHATSPALLRALFGLTSAEANVAVMLGKGDSVDEIRVRFRYTKETARWYCKQVLQKTGCRSRSELVKLLTRLPSEC